MAYCEGVGVVACPHASNLVGVLKGLVNEFEHADVAEVAVLVDGCRHPLDELEGSVVLVVLVEARGAGVLSAVLVYSSLP
jgi:hypothetical protein